MIEKYLQDHNKIGRLNNSYLINTDDLEKAHAEIKIFLNKTLLSHVDLSTSADYRCIKKKDSKTKNIAVDQIRDLQDFLNSTSVITGKKVGVIYGADEMNLNAANSCLKILEEPTVNSYLFLITKSARSILPTIKSRCAKINHFYHLQEHKPIKDEFIRPCLKSASVKDHLDFIKIFAAKDRDIWNDFAEAVEEVLVKFGKKSLGMNVELSVSEMDLFKQFKNHSPLYIQQKHHVIKEIINNTNKYDLDLRSNVLLLLDKLRH